MPVFSILLCQILSFPATWYEDIKQCKWSLLAFSIYQLLIFNTTPSVYNTYVKISLVYIFHHGQKGSSNVSKRINIVLFWMLSIRIWLDKVILNGCRGKIATYFKERPIQAEQRQLLKHLSSTVLGSKYNS